VVPTRKEIKLEKRRQKRTDRGEEVSDLEDKIYIYKCPLYRTSLRLMKGQVSSDNAPVAYLNLPTKEHPHKWIKRSVALLLEVKR